mgnify:CR=1 FL=1
MYSPKKIRVYRGVYSFAEASLNSCVCTKEKRGYLKGKCLETAHRPNRSAGSHATLANALAHPRLLPYAPPSPTFSLRARTSPPPSCDWASTSSIAGGLAPAPPLLVGVRLRAPASSSRRIPLPHTGSWVPLSSTSLDPWTLVRSKMDAGAPPRATVSAALFLNDPRYSPLAPCLPLLPLLTIPGAGG